VTIGIGVVCDHGNYVIVASEKRASYGDLRPNDEAGKIFDFDPLRLVGTVAGRLGVLHEIVGELTVHFDKLAKSRRNRPIYREHVENAIDDARFRQLSRLYRWAARANYGLTWEQLLTGKLPHGKMNEVVWADIKRTVFSVPLLAEIIVGGYVADEPVLFKASGKQEIEGSADPPVFVIGSTGAKYAMDHLNRRGQNIFSSFAQTVLHIHEAMEIARKKDHDGYIGRCDAYVVLNRHRQGFEQFAHGSHLLRGWAKAYAGRESTTSLKSGIAVDQAQLLLKPLAPGLRFERYRKKASG
jgi:20S proteasome alpha/beta subunit